MAVVGADSIGLLQCISSLLVWPELGNG